MSDDEIRSMADRDYDWLTAEAERRMRIHGVAMAQLTEKGENGRRITKADIADLRRLWEDVLDVTEAVRWRSRRLNRPQERYSPFQDAINARTRRL